MDAYTVLAGTINPQSALALLASVAVVVPALGFVVALMGAVINAR